MNMMPKILKASFLILVLLGLAGCLDEENSFDYSQCQETIDFRFLEQKPWLASQNGSSIHVFIDTSQDGYFYSIQYYFECNSSRDTCWYDTSLHRRYRGDTLSFVNAEINFPQFTDLGFPVLVRIRGGLVLDSGH